MNIDHYDSPYQHDNVKGRRPPLRLRCQCRSRYPGVGEETFEGTAVHDISFRGASGSRIDAYLVTPIVGHSFPGIMFVHPLPGSRKSFLDEAVKLADRRICSLCVDAPWSRGMIWAKKMGNPEHDREEFIGVI